MFALGPKFVGVYLSVTQKWRKKIQLTLSAKLQKLNYKLLANPRLA